MPAASARTLAAAAFVALYQGARTSALLPDDDPGRLVAFVLQGLHQASDLLPEAGELRHAAESGGAVNRRRYPQAAEDQAHDERQHDHGDQPPRHRPVPQRQRLRTREAPNPVDFLARLLPSPERSWALTTPWFPIAYVLAGYAPVAKPPRRRWTGAAGAPQGQRLHSGGTEMGCGYSNGWFVLSISKWESSVAVVSCDFQLRTVMSAQLRASVRPRSAGPGRLGGDDWAGPGTAQRKDLVKVVCSATGR